VRRFDLSLSLGEVYLSYLSLSEERSALPIATEEVQRQHTRDAYSCTQAIGLRETSRDKEKGLTFAMWVSFDALTVCHHGTLDCNYRCDRITPRSLLTAFALQSFAISLTLRSISALALDRHTDCSLYLAWLRKSEISNGPADC
jgi:hypothetical protein